jgi:CRP/FNR family cyclic AMP-dependent transcriptional regulator
MTPDARSSVSASPRFDYRAFIAKYGGAMIVKCVADQIVYAQDEAADAAFYIVAGAVKVTVLSAQGKEAVLALLNEDDFFGEECLHPHRRRAATIVATTNCELVRLDHHSIVRALGEDPDFGNVYLGYVLRQNNRLRQELIEQLFQSSEQRLARILLTLANTEVDAHWSAIALPVTQETLAHMVGTTRPRINQFMTKFRKLGYIAYDDKIQVHNSLRKIITNDEPQRFEC